MSTYFLILAGSLAATATPRATPAVDIHELWVSANIAYRQGNYDDAAKGYRLLLESGVDDGTVYYNLGNAELRRGELGLAIAAYHAARALLPRDEDVAANLRWARTQTRDAIAPISPSTASRVLFFWHYVLSRHELAVAFATVHGLAWLCLAIAVLWRRRGAYWPAGFLFVLSVLLASSSVARAWWPTTLAIVRAPEISARVGPDTESVERFRLHAGAEARVLDSDGGWMRVALSDGKQGWVAAKEVTLVRY